MKKLMLTCYCQRCYKPKLDSLNMRTSGPCYLGFASWPSHRCLRFAVEPIKKVQSRAEEQQIPQVNTRKAMFAYVSEDAAASTSLVAVPRPRAAPRAQVGQLMRPDYVTFNDLINF